MSNKRYRESGLGFRPLSLTTRISGRWHKGDVNVKSFCNSQRDKCWQVPEGYGILWYTRENSLKSASSGRDGKVGTNDDTTYQTSENTTLGRYCLMNFSFVVLGVDY